MSGIVQILMASLFFSRHLFTIRHRGEMHCIVLKKQKQKETDSSPFWSQFIGISVPFLKKWDVRQCGPKRKGREWCRQGEQKCLGWISRDINHYHNTEGLQLRWRDREKERRSKEIRQTVLKTLRIGMKPLIIITNVRFSSSSPIFSSSSLFTPSLRMQVWRLQRARHRGNVTNLVRMRWEVMKI